MVHIYDTIQNPKEKSTFKTHIRQSALKTGLFNMVFLTILSPYVHSEAHHSTIEASREVANLFGILDSVFILKSNF